MDYRKELPYLGEQNETGEIILLGNNVQRPDYGNLLNDRYCGKIESLGVLVGLDIKSFWNTVGEANKRNDTEFLMIIQDFSEKIDFALQNGDLKELNMKRPFIIKKYPGLSRELSYEMREQAHFKLSDFISWAKWMQFTLPNEIIDFLLEENGLEMRKTDALELGQLRKEKEKWSDSIKASVDVGLWLEKTNVAITHKDLEKKVLFEFPDVPKTTIHGMIWKAIPDHYKNKGGAAKQKK